MREAHATLFSSEEILLVMTTDHECPGGMVVQNSEESNPFREGEQQNTNTVKINQDSFVFFTTLS